MRSLHVFAVVMALPVFASCKSRAPQGSDVAAAYTSPAPGEIRIGWYTNRERNYTGQGDSQFTSDVTTVLPAKGVLTFQVPPGYRYSQPVVRSPRLDTDDSDFNREMIFGAYDNYYQSRATVFVHGYNHTLENAVERAAQLFAALATPPQGQGHVAMPFVFGWPSLGRTVDDIDIAEWIRTGTPFFARAYRRDEVQAGASHGHLAEFLYKICYGQSAYRDINIVAHSLGTRLTSETLAEMSRAMQAQMPPGTSPAEAAARMPCRIRNLVLASGDMSLFKFRVILPDLLLIADKITLYVNARAVGEALRIGVTADLPLALSKLLHFLRQFELGPRIGQMGVFTNLLDERVDVVAMNYLTDAGESGGHLNIFSSPSVLFDLTATLNGQMGPGRQQQQGLARRFYLLR